MDILSIILIGIGLAMDAFAVSLAKGMCLNKKYIKVYAFKLAFFFGFFQALMPFIGYYCGVQFASYIQKVDHWVAFILLGIVGIHMIKEAATSKKEEEVCLISYKNIIVLAIATSIDALAIGVSFAFLNVNIIHAVVMIGIITFILCFIGVFFGKKIGSLFLLISIF